MADNPCDSLLATLAVDAAVIPAFFPRELVGGLCAWIDQSPSRKVWFDLSSATCPGIISEAAMYASSCLGLIFNCALLKWYRLDDSSPSEAYEFHVDPPNLRSVSLCLVTLKGSAQLVYESTRSELVAVNCDENTAVLLQSSLSHRVTPPLGPIGERYLLFLGFRQSS